MSYSLYDTIFLNTGNLITSTFRDDIVVLENTKETGTTDKDCRLVIRSNEDGESDIHLENINGSTRNGWRIMNYTQGEYFSIGYRVGYTTSVSDYNSGWNEYLTVKTNGNVGIRTTNPTSTLQVGHTGTTTDTSLHVIAGNSYTATIAAYGSSQGTGKLYIGQSTSYGGGIIYNGDDDPDISSTEDAVSFYRRNGGTDTEVFYYANNSSTVNFIGDCYIKNSGEALRLYDTNFPDSKRTFIGFYPEDSTGVRKAYLGFTDTDTNDFTILNQYANGDTRIGAGNGIKMLITSEGNVGIGTNNPLRKLHVYDNSDTGETTYPYVAIFERYVGDIQNSTNPAQGGLILLKTSDTNHNVSSAIGWAANNNDNDENDSSLSFWTTYNDTISQRMLIDADGKVGIGTNSPAAKLDVYSNDSTGSSTNVALTIRADSNSYSSVTNGFGSRIQFQSNRGYQANQTMPSADIKAYIYSGAGSTGDYHALDLDVYGDDTILRRGITIYARSSGIAETIVHGYLGIGTDPSNHLQVKGNTYCNGNITYTGSLTQSSDDRLKINEEYITSATETLLKLRPQVYDKLTSVGGDVSESRKEAGLIAQEVYVHAPELRYILDVPEEFKEDLDNYTNLYNEDPTIDPDYSGWNTSNVMGVDYQSLTPYLIKAVQEKHEELQETRIELNLIKGFLKQKYPDEL